MGKIKDKNSVPILIIITGLMIAVFMMFLPTMLMAGTISLPKTGETTCYDTSGTLVDCAGTGQDGDIQAGVEWPDPRFTDNGDGTITDNITGLMWTQNATVACDANTYWQVALDYVAGMNSGTNPNYGYTDWHLPNILEMFSLSHQGESDFINWLTNQGFTNVGSFYWTSTTLASKPEKSWIYNLYSNFTYTLDKDEFTACFWPVRAGQQGSVDPAYPANIRKTGQTSCYNATGTVIDCTGTGQDGEIQAGVTWPDPRFTDNGDGTIKDNLTGLNWMQDPTVLGKMSWQESLDYLSGLNDVGGGNNRLPNVNEIMSLIDFSKTASMIPSTNNLLSPDYSSWTGNTVSLKLSEYEKNAYEVFTVSTDYGVQFHSDKGKKGPIWPLGPGVVNILDDSAANYAGAGVSNDPVNTHTGELFFHEPIDLFLGGPMPLFFQRYYASYLARSFVVGELGDNWRHNFEWDLYWVGNTITLVTPTGKVLEYLGDGQGTWTLQTSRTDVPYQIVQNGQEITLGDPQSGLVYTFNAEGRLAEIQDGKGNALILTYNTTGDDAGKLAQVADGLGRALVFTYAAYGSVRKLTLVGATYDGTQQASVSFDYDATGDTLLTFTDARGNATTYEYKDTSGTADHALMTRRTLPEGNTPYTQTYYGTDTPSASGRVETQTDANGNTHTFTYNSLDTTMTDPLANTRNHTHNANGELTANKRQDGLSTAVAYNANGHRNSVTDLLSDTTTYTYHEASGRLASVTNTEGDTTTYTYTTRNHSTGVVFYDRTGIAYPDNTTETFVYDTSGNITSRTDRGGNTWTFTYNINGQVLTTTNPPGGVVTNTYNADSTLASRTDASGNTNTYAYDSRKRLATVTHADGTTRTFTYDNNDNLLTITDERGNTTTFTYDGNNNLSTLTDHISNTTAFTYDGMDRVVSVTDPLGNASNRTYDELQRLKTFKDLNGNTTTYDYDARGRITSITDEAGKIWARTYDAESIIASITDPLSYTTTFASDKMGRITQTTSALGNTTNVTYDSRGRVTAVENPLNETTTSSYDDRGLLTGGSLPGGINALYTRNELGLITTITDPNGNPWQRAYDVQGRRTSTTDPLGNVITYQYDNRNRVTQIDLPASGVDLTHDAVGNVTRRLYTDDTDLNYTYDVLNRLTASDGLELSYDANGRLTGSNGLTITRNAGGQIATLTLAVGKAITYTYNSRNLLATVTDWLGGTTTFTYDAADRLTTIARPNGVTTKYTYDDDGNINGVTEGVFSIIALTRDAKGQVTAATRNVPLESKLTDSTTTFTYDAASQVSTYIYDAMGHLTDDGTRTYTWDLASRLMGYTEGSTSISFTYDAMGNRLTRTEGNTTNSYVWNYAFGLPSISVEKQSGSDLKYYVHTPEGSLLYRIEASGSTRKDYHYDEMGNTLFLTNSSGTAIDSYAYSPYGTLLASTGTEINPFTWQGQFGVMQEGTSGLYYMRARYYESDTGRFITRDPIKTISPRTINPYQYVLGNPLRFVDPSGRESDAARRDRESDEFLRSLWEHRAKGAASYAEYLREDARATAQGSANNSFIDSINPDDLQPILVSGGYTGPTNARETVNSPCGQPNGVVEFTMGLPKDQGYNELPAIDWSDNAVRVTLSLKAGQSVPDGKRFVNEAGVFLKPIFDPPVYRVSGVILEETTNVKRIGVPSATEFGIR